VISLESRQFGPPKVRFHELPGIERDQIVLPDGVLERVERHTVGFSRHAERLRAAGRHLRRGLLFHGPPGTGKSRRRLLELYARGLAVDADLDRLVERTQGASGAFIRELLRKAALFAADESDELVVRDQQLDEALQDLVVEGGKLTESLLGGPSA
jgi:ATP-dependent 26S proteasome regulatory subunit